MEVNISIDKTKREQVANGLKKLLADTYILYLKTHNFHWNVTGPHFAALHQMFESQYQELFEAVDEIAERIRALGIFAPGSHAQYAELASISEQTGVPKALDMVKELMQDHEAVTQTAHKAFKSVESTGDEATADLLIERMAVHEKAAWMLRSMLE